jgi:hypothetical protein
MAKSPLVQFLSVNGDGSGSSSINTDLSGGASYYIDRIRDTVGTEFRVAHIAIVRLMFMVRDSGAFSADEFGNTTALTNGVNILYTEASGEQTSLTPLPIKLNAGFGAYAYDVSLPSGTVDQVLLSRWTFSKFMGSSAGLVLKPGDKLSADVADDFSGLLDFTICAQGYAESV